ncbi:MAG: ATP-binding protein [Sulfurovum sp.]|nr:ATP-binding protein [Sulfurovum sp.]
MITINKNDIKYMCKFEPIKINIILDNLLSNSKKETINAKNVTINFFQRKDILMMEYLDDGSGIDSSIVDLDTIFDIGIGNYNQRFRTWNVSCKKLLNDMKSTIAVERQSIGIKFLVRFGI